MRSKMFIVVKKNDVFKAVIVAIVTVFLVAMTAVGGVAPVYLAAEKGLSRCTRWKPTKRWSR